MKQKMYDPDEFILDKETWLGIIDQVHQYWQNNAGGNQTLLSSLSLLKWWVGRQSDDDVKKIWQLIIKFIDRLRYQNAIHGAVLDKEQNWGSVMLQLESNKSKKSVFGL